jgi:hypothetical protein
MHSKEAISVYSSAWRLRVHSDADLQELHALAVLLNGQVDDALQILEQVVATGPRRFGSERVGSYDLLGTALSDGFLDYAKLARFDARSVVDSRAAS